MRRGHVGSPQIRAPRKLFPQAWATFVDPGTIQDSYNVSSVTSPATGQYTLVFGMPFGYAAGATGYAVTVVHRNVTGGAAGLASVAQSLTEGNAYNVNSVTVQTTNSAATSATTLCAVIVWGP